MGQADIGHALGGHPNLVRYAAATGTLLIRWEGAREATVWNVPAPKIDPRKARIELARRYLHTFGLTTPSLFAVWAGIAPASGQAVFDALEQLTDRPVALVLNQGRVNLTGGYYGSYGNYGETRSE
jgi:hypothetical protein